MQLRALKRRLADEDDEWLPTRRSAVGGWDSIS
jgi:hypothetical protein